MIAWLSREGIVYIDTKPTPLRLRIRQHCLAFFGGGLVGITPEGDLAYFDIQTQTITRYLAESILAFSSISIASDLAAGVLISGDRSPTQRILLLSNHGDVPQVDVWPTPDSTVCAAYLDSNNFLLLATRGRQLIGFNIGSHQLTHQISYRSISGMPVRGVVIQCKLTVWQDNTYAVLATDNGEVCVWDISSNVLHNRGAYRGLKENDSTLVDIETLPDQGKIIIATTTKINMISIAGDDEIVLKSPITQCCLTPDGWLITVDTIGKCVTWYKDGCHYKDWIYLNGEPVSVSACAGDEGAVFVGYNTGTVGKFQPDKEPDEEDGLMLFDRAAISVIALDNKRVIAASENGQYRIMGIQPSEGHRDIKPVEPFRNEYFIRRLGQSDDFVSCGRSSSGDCNTSVVVIRSNDIREKVFETREWVNDMAVTGDGQVIHVVFATKICRYKKISGRWKPVAERDVNASHIVSCSHDKIAVILQDQDLSWLEIWTAQGGYQTIAAMELPFLCSSLCNAGDAIAVGAIDGRHCRVLMRWAKHKPVIWDTVKQVIGFYSKLSRDEFWAAASLRTTRRFLGFLRPLDWQQTIMAHWLEFDTRQQSMGHILVDGKHQQWVETLFKRLGSKLQLLGLISEHEQELMVKAIVSKQERIPNLQSEKAKAVYLAACLEIGRIRLPSKSDEGPTQHAPWWDSLLP